MRGQISIEYLIALSIFIGLISYIYLKYVGNISPFIEDVIKEEKRAEAFQIANILVNDPGEPVNWNTNSPIRVGLANESTNMTNWITRAKVNALSTQCSKLNNLLSIERPFNVLIFDVNPSNGIRTLLASCISPVLRIDQINATVRRYAVYDGGKIAEIIVQV
jgi:outer membrane murein-binding lipoprotein Lpp